MTLRIGIVECAIVLLAGCGRFSFDAIVPVDADDADDDASIGLDDGDPLPVVDSYWVTTLATRGAPSFWTTRTLDVSGFAEPCPSDLADNGYRFLLAHPTLPYVYAIEEQLEGVALGCTTYGITPVLGGVATRLISRAVLDPGADVGFFNADAPGDTAGVYRFTVDGVGTPVAGGDSVGPNGSGPMALDGTTLYVTGIQEFGAHALGVNLTLPPGAAVATSTCSVPTGIFVHHGNRDRIIVTCDDSDDWYEHAANPSAPAMTGTFTGMRVGQLVPLSATRALIARTAPPRLAVVDFETDTIVDGPALPSASHALAVSPDQVVVVATYPIAIGFQLAAFTLSGTTLRPLATIDDPDATEILAVAITVPGP